MRMLAKKFHDPALARMASIAADLGARMAAENPPYVLQASSHSAALFRLADQAGIGGAGVAGSGDLQVSANGTPNMSVNVAAGQVLVPGTLGSSVGMPANANAQPGYGLPSSFTSQGSYFGYNDGTVNLAIAAANASNPRIDLIVASVQDSQYSGSNNQWVLQVVTGTPAASPVAPSAPANSVALAEILVGANVTQIVAGNITDKRPRLALISPTLPTCRVYRSAALTDANTARTLAPFDTVQWDNYSGFNTGTHVYTVPAAGIYLVTGGWTISGVSTTSSIEVDITKNGSTTPQAYGSVATSTGNPAVLTAGVADLVQCSAGDTLGMLYFDGGGHAIAAGSSTCFMSVAKVSN